MVTSTTPDPPADIALTELAKLQLQQALETIRYGVGLWQQASTILVIADITLVGYAIANKVAFAFLLGTVFPYVLIKIADNTNKALKPVFYTAISLEQRYGDPSVDGLMTTYYGYAISAAGVSGIPGRRPGADNGGTDRRAPAPGPNALSFRLGHRAVLGAWHCASRRPGNPGQLFRLETLVD